MALTDEQVFAAADQMQREGVKVTVRRLLLADSGRTVASDSPSPIGFQSNAERLQASPLQRARSIGQAMPSCERSLLPVP